MWGIIPAAGAGTRIQPLGFSKELLPVGSRFDGKMPAPVLGALHDLWTQRQRRDEYMGTLVNEYLARGGRAVAVRAGQAYVDVGTLHGYRQAVKLLTRRSAAAPDGRPPGSDGSAAAPADQPRRSAVKAGRS